MSTYKKIPLIFKYLFSRDYRDYRKVRHLHIFDPDYFLTLVSRADEHLHPELPDGGEDPLWSYFAISRVQLGQESFSGRAWRQLCDPHPLFDTYYYASSHFELIGTRHPFSHYLLEGWKLDLNPSPLFNIKYYRETGRWDERMGEPLSHYIRHGLGYCINCSALFDHGWYLDQTPYPKAVRNNGVKHYKLFGAQAGKSPIPLFNPHHYLDQAKEREHARVDPLLHYAVVGEKSGLQPHHDFDPDYYRNRYLKESKTESALASYLSHGVKIGVEINNRLEDLSSKPKISIIVPVFDPEPRYLNNCIRSVLYQTYPHWELCLVDDCSTNSRIREIIEAWSSTDPRIRFFCHEQNLGISAATQTGAENSTGEYLGFLDNDDELAFACLARVVEQINITGGDVYYTDEDLVGDDGSRLSAFYKPQFNRALLYSHNYITHFVVVSRARFLAAGGLTGAIDGAQDFDLMLRLAGIKAEFYHIPQILYHWRAIATSTSISHDQKPHAHEAGKGALGEYFKRCGIDAEIKDGPVNFHYQVQPRLKIKPSVTVIVSSCSSDDLNRKKIERLSAKTGYENCTYVIAEGIATQGPSVFEAGGSVHPIKVPPREINRIVQQTSDDMVAILGYCAEDISDNWLLELVSKFSLDNAIGMICGRESYGNSDGPSLAVADITNNSTVYYQAFLAMSSRHANGLHNLQYINCCDYQITVIKRALIEEIGGFEVDLFPAHLAMLDLSYKLVSSGYKILYTPDAIVSFEDFPMMLEDEEPEALMEKKNFQNRHLSQLRQFNRWYNTGQVVKEGVSEEEFLHWLTGIEK